MDFRTSARDILQLLIPAPALTPPGCSLPETQTPRKKANSSKVSQSLQDKTKIDKKNKNMKKTDLVLLYIQTFIYVTFIFTFWEMEINTY